MDKKFSLKDHLFNQQKITKIAQEIHRVYPAFDEKQFIQRTVGKFPELELKQRISWISDTLRVFLPESYRKAIAILLESLPPPNDNTKTDDDFGDFIYAPYADFVAKYGCNKEHLPFSLQALREITTRFSAEDAIRYFINAFPEETLRELLTWSIDPHYHVRRLASEGTRPKLPWAQKINIAVEKTLPILDNLFSDTTRFVTRSVANHLNDISKIDPELTLSTLNKWQQSQKQNQREMEYIIKHSLRTLVKSGYKKAIEFLNYSSNPEVALSEITIRKTLIQMGEFVEFEFTLMPKRDEWLIIDYIIHFQSKSGKQMNKKVFKIKRIEAKKDNLLVIHKRHLLLKNMTTRKLYPGNHIIEIQINGKQMATKAFELIED